GCAITSAPGSSRSRPALDRSRAGGGGGVGEAGRMALTPAVARRTGWPDSAESAMSFVPARLRRLVTRRAGGRCDYCGLAQVGQEATFHSDHIIPTKAGGETTPDNLALACVSRSLRKQARRSVRDPQTGRQF